MLTLLLPDHILFLIMRTDETSFLYRITNKKFLLLFTFFIIFSPFYFQNNIEANKQNSILVAEPTEEEITIDGKASEKIWNSAETLTAWVQDGAVGDTTVKIKAIYDKEKIYFFVRWPDTTKNALKAPWEFDDEQKKWIRKFKNKKNLETGFPDHFEIENEDRFAINWNVNNSISGFNITGCQVLCHGDRMHTNAPEEWADVWHWKADRTNRQGYMDDKFLSNQISRGWEDEDIKAARVGDSWDKSRGILGMNGNYFKNSQIFLKNGEPFEIPLYWKPKAVGEDSLFITQEDIIKGEAILIKDPYEINKSNIIPGYILFRPQGSRGDIDAKGIWKDGFWNLEFSRKLLTGEKDDVQFKITGNFRFGIAVMDNCGGFQAFRKGHSFSIRAYTLQFGGIASQLSNNLMLLKDYITMSIGYLYNKNEELALSELGYAQGILDESDNRLAEADPTRFLKLKRKLIDARLNLNEGSLLKLYDVTSKFIYFLQGKIEREPLTLKSKFMLFWVRVQSYVFIFLSISAIWLLYSLVAILRQKEWKRMGIFLFIVILPIYLEGIGRIGILSGYPFLNNLSFMTNEYARLIFAIIMCFGIVYSRLGFKDISNVEKRLRSLNDNLEENVKRRTKELSILLETTVKTSETMNLSSILQIFSDILIQSFSSHTFCRVAIWNKSKQKFIFQAYSAIRTLPVDSPIGGMVSADKYKFIDKISKEQKILTFNINSHNLLKEEKEFLLYGIFKSVLIIPFIEGKELLGFTLLNEARDTKRKITTAENIDFYQTIANHMSITINNALLFNKNKSIFLNTIEALAAAIDAKDSYTNYHSKKVAEYAVKIAKEMNLSASQIALLRTSCLLHDIGKIGINDEILKKPGKLTDEEFLEIKKHPKKAMKILEAVIELDDIIENIEAHHERFDGNGYPAGLKGKEIPLLARIIAIADTFDAMISSRVYRKGVGIDKAILEIKNCSGTQFDPEVVDAFLNIVDSLCDSKEKRGKDNIATELLS